MISESEKPLKIGIFCCHWCLLVKTHMLRSRVLELRQRAAEDQFHAADRTVTMFRDNDLSHILFDRVLLVLVGTVDEHDDIGILFEGSRFTQIREHRALIRALFDGAARAAPQPAPARSTHAPAPSDCARYRRLPARGYRCAYPRPSIADNQR